MSEPINSKMFRDFSNEWEQLFKSGKFDEAIEIGIKAFQTFRKAGDKKWADGSLNLIAVTIPSALSGKDPIHIAENNLSCSFCNKPGTEKSLIAGPDVLICNPCVELCAKHFLQNNKKT